MSYGFEYTIPCTHAPYILGATMQDVDRVSNCSTQSNIRYNKYTPIPYIPETTVRDVERVSECHTDSNIRYHTTHTHTPYIPGETVREVLVSEIARVCALVFHLLCQYNWWRIHMCDMTYLFVWRYVCVYDWMGVRTGIPTPVPIQLVTHSYVSRDLLACVMICVRVWLGRCVRWYTPPVPIQFSDSFICVTWLTRMCDLTHSYVWHDSCIYVTWFIYLH